MKSMKKCVVTKEKISKSIKLDKRRDRRRSSAGMFYTSSAGAVTSLILIATLSFLSSAFLNITGLAGANTYADSISMTVSTDNLTINMAPMSSSGEFAKSANMNIAVSTTSSSGYNLSIASSTGNTNLTSGSNSITSISSAISESTFSSSSTYNNQWGYKPSNLYNSSTEQIVTNTDFRPLPGTAGEIIAKTKCANGTSPCTNPVDNYTLSIGTRTTNTTPEGNYVSDTFIIAAVTNKGVITCDSSKLCVQYDGNGLSYPGTSSQDPRTVNNVNYNSTTTSQTITKYAHTPNVSDAGEASGTYSSSMDTTDTVTIDGAASLNVTIYYDAESTSYDWVSVYQSPFDISNNNDATVSTITGNLSGKLSGRKSGRTKTYSSWYTKSYTVSGDTVKFHFISDSSSNYYGYYAIITGTSTVYERSVSSGEYATPTGTNSVFHGWSTSQTTPGSGLPSDVEYANESEILTKMPGDEGETKTLYAVWQQGYPITFTYDSNVTKIDVLDASGATVGTITSSGQSLVLAQGDTYTIKPVHATGYATNTITKTSGAGTISGKQFTVGAGSATLSVTSKLWDGTMQSFDCSILANIGDTTNARDTRDNEVYLIGKLADGKCWMLDNLRLDLRNSTVLNNTTESNTNASTTTLNYLKNGGGSTSDRYPTAKINNVPWTSSSQNYYSIPMTISTYKDQTTKSYGEGSGKIGVYYNYCAASAGNYCFGDGTKAGSPSGNATEDICPKGWRMPTGGSSSEYQALYTAYSSDVTSFLNALSTPLSGYFYSGSADSQGTFGDFWSSTYYFANYMYELYVDSYSVKPSGSNYRNRGYSVRCLLSS